MKRPGETDRVHENRWFSVTHEERGDGPSASHWYRVVGADSAMTIPVLDRGEIVMLRGTRDTTGDAPLYELPCGAIDDGESPTDAAARELREETGYRCSSLLLLGEFFATPGISPMKTAVYEATGLEAGPAALEHGEDWAAETLTRTAVLERVAAGLIRDAGTLAALMLWMNQASADEYADSPARSGTTR